MNTDEFEFISQLLKKRSGLALTADKTYLLESRLLPIARTFKIETLPEFVRFIRSKPDEKVIAQVVDAMTTNESMFFRDQKPFDQFRQVILPRLKEVKGGGKIRIWSAACSNGQEPYTIAMCLLEEAVKMSGFTYEIIATDISPRVLEKAKQGIYTQFEIQRGLPIQMLLKYFKQLPDSTWQANENLRSMVTFRQQNLLEEIGMLGKFDIILCRNVLIYFDEPTKRGILEKISRMLEKHGVLLLGSTETILGISDKYITLENERGVHVLAA
ncbi:MAG TPA: protein-glutamate O-methyltransferase CheR [Rickettsiales bacterium]|nr:protein-glutamate O-methyltransferase CheR [Rickettsiales bacterium]